MKWIIKWIKENWRWTALNLFALAVMASLLWESIGIKGEYKDYNPMFVSSGKWAIRFLLLSLLMTPLNTIFGWRSAVKLRKPAGLWAFEFGAVHFFLNVAFLKEEWFRYPIPDTIATLGVIGLIILTLMAFTSSQWAMKRMGKWWKRLHRMVYAAGIIAVAHALLEAPNKRVAFTDPQVATEVGLYLGILIFLLLARIPKIRTALARLKYKQAGEKLLPGSKTPIA